MVIVRTPLREIILIVARLFKKFLVHKTFTSSQMNIHISIDYTNQNFHQVLTQRKSQHATMPRRYFSTIGANRCP